MMRLQHRSSQQRNNNNTSFKNRTNNLLHRRGGNSSSSSSTGKKGNHNNKNNQLVKCGLFFFALYGIVITLYLISSHSLLHLEAEVQGDLHHSSLRIDDRERHNKLLHHPQQVDNNNDNGGGGGNPARIENAKKQHGLLDKSPAEVAAAAADGSSRSGVKTIEAAAREEEEHPQEEYDDDKLVTISAIEKQKHPVVINHGAAGQDDDTHSIARKGVDSLGNNENLPSGESKDEKQGGGEYGRIMPEKKVNGENNNSGEQQFILKAYLEPYSPSDDHTNTKPLPVRNTSPSKLKVVSFPRVNSCRQLQAQLPIDEWHKYGHDDPFLPWIHDVFPSHDGKLIRFVAQNRRRCHTGKGNEDLMTRLEPQVALLQPVAVKRVKNADDATSRGNVRYQLTSHEKADHDGKETRFICRFSPSNLETLSVYPFNYEYINWKKEGKPMLDNGKHSTQFWTAQQLFDCPVPTQLQGEILAFKSDRASMFVDLIPIRTPVRIKSTFFDSSTIPRKFGSGGKMSSVFNATEEWGDHHILPSIEASGRWENIPICPIVHPLNATSSITTPQHQPPPHTSSSTTTTKKPHTLVGCTWTASKFKHRGDSTTINDGEARLREWITFHLMVGFDHLYIYDNSGAKNFTGSLQSVTDQFPPDKVTKVHWPCSVCNNNWPMHLNPGERSSQYAAEASCLQRFGPHTEWMAGFDVDEYMVPMGSGTSGLKDLVREADKEGTKILVFKSARAKPRVDLMEAFYDGKECTREDGMEPHCLVPSSNRTFLETYNCDYTRAPRPDRFKRASKQIYRPDFVQLHFVHYSTVTTDLSNPQRLISTTSEQNTQKFTNEITQAYLLHSKTVSPLETSTRNSKCISESKDTCYLGYRCPDSSVPQYDENKPTSMKNEMGEYCNCFVNSRIENDWVPKLRRALDLLEL